jgi:nucleotide-binding universal stress UspA family protein
LAGIEKKTKMKKLLVLTDFTANASHAAAVALHLAYKLGDSIQLYHTLPYAPLIPSDSSGPYVTETASMLFENSKEYLTQEADKLREAAVMSPGFIVDIEQKNGDGSLGYVISKLTEQPAIEMVVMGGRSGGALEHVLSGSDTAAVMRKARKAVLIIPATADYDIPHKIVFATDFGTADIPSVSFLHDLSGRLHCELDIVHMVTHSEVNKEIGAEVAFRKYLDEQQISYSQVQTGDVHRGLQQYCIQKGADLLAMTHGRHSFIARLFGHSETGEMISDQRFSVLVFPPEFK